MRALFGVLIITLSLLALPGHRWRYARWAYVAFIALGLLYFPLKARMALAPRACNWDLSPAAVGQALQNYAHMVLFAAFLLLSYRQFRGPAALGAAALATLGMGAAVELAQGVTGEGNCRARDLIPDAVGILVAVSAIIGTRRLRGPGESVAPRASQE